MFYDKNEFGIAELEKTTYTDTIPLDVIDNPVTNLCKNIKFLRNFKNFRSTIAILEFSMTKLTRKSTRNKAIKLFAGFLLFTYRLFQKRLCLEGKNLTIV